MNITTKHSNVKTTDKFELWRDQDLKAHFEIYWPEKRLCYQFSLPEHCSCVLLYNYSTFAKNPTKTITIFEALRVRESHIIKVNPYLQL